MQRRACIVLLWVMADPGMPVTLSVVSATVTS